MAGPEGERKAAHLSPSRSNNSLESWRSLGRMPDTRSAAVSPFDGGQWQWTRASNPQDALRRYRDGRMQP